MFYVVSGMPTGRWVADPGNESAVALYERVTKAIPRLPVLNRPLSDAPLLTPVERIAAELGYDLI